MAATLTLITGLVALKAAMRPDWRASARTGLASCVHGHWWAHAGGSLDRAGHLALCAARLEPVRTDYVEWAAAAVLALLLAGEVRLLVHGGDEEPRTRR